MSNVLTIQSLGAQGDGVAAGEGGPVFVPFALPGERVTAAIEGERATLMAVLDPSPDRVAPACRHFGDCGGCAVQHLDDTLYRAWKRQKLVDALKGRGLEVEVAPLVPCAPATRRRAAFSARPSDGALVFGYHARLSHRLVDVEECPVLLPGIVTALPVLRRLARLAAQGPKAFRILVTLTDSGLDVAIDGTGRLGNAARRDLTAFVLAEGLARLSVEGELLLEPRKPQVMADDVAIAVPAAGFLQATAEAEAAMAAIVTGHLARAKRVTDLFAGSGTFALRLARNSEVHAVEGDAAALAALDRAFRGATGLKRVTGERRDLFVRPLTFKELAAFDGLVFDPPRAGAEDQAKQIARASIPRVAAVSCNPGTLARDLRILVDGGYRIVSVTPIDQFLWSPHVEAVAVLEKPGKRR